MDCLMGKCCVFWTCQCHPLALQGRVINKSMWTGRLISCWTMYIYNINMGTQREGNFGIYRSFIELFIRQIKETKLSREGRILYYSWFLLLYIQKSPFNINPIVNIVQQCKSDPTEQSQLMFLSTTYFFSCFWFAASFRIGRKIIIEYEGSILEQDEVF